MCSIERGWPAWGALALLLGIIVCGCGQDEVSTGAIQPDPETAERPSSSASKLASDIEAGDPEASDSTRRVATSSSVGLVEAWLGKWTAATRDGVCIELHEDGRFEMTDRRRRGGDVVIRGRYEIAPDGEAATVALHARSIQIDRYVTACRKHVEPARRVSSYRILGQTVRVGDTVTMRLQRRDDGRPELCAGDRCQPLRHRS